MIRDQLCQVGGLMDGRTALVMGVISDRSLAFSIARWLRRAGARVAITYQDVSLEARARPLADELGAEFSFPCDVRKPEEIEAVRRTLAAEWGQLSTLVHSLAYAAKEALRGDVLDGLTSERFREAMDVSAYSLMESANVFRPMLREAGDGSIISLSFVGSRLAIPNYNLMGMAKAALESGIRYLALDLGKEDGIRVNCVCAGGVRTLAASGIGSFRSILELGEQFAPLRRNVSADEVGRAALFLASPLATGVTGEILNVDCGLSSTMPGFSRRQPDQ